MADLSARTPLRVLSRDEIVRLLAEHQLYLETEYHQGHRANFSSADLTGRDFSGLNLRGTKWIGPCSEALIVPEPTCEAPGSGSELCTLDGAPPRRQLWSSSQR
jgi:uncharacterized protein YjbI with pentapeptide repeats